MPRKRATEPCSCGCGQMPVSGMFCAGHDQKMLHKIREKAGGIFMLEAIVNKHIKDEEWKLNFISVRDVVVKGEFKKEADELKSAEFILNEIK